MGVALRAAHSAAPEPRLRRVSAIRLQSLTRGGDPSLPCLSRQLSPPSLTAVRPEQSVIAVGELAIAVSVAPSGRVRRHQRVCESADDLVLVGPSGCATSCAADTFMPLPQCSGSSLIPWNDDPAIGADNPAGVSFSRKPSLASEFKARIGRRMGTWPVRRRGGASGPVVICSQQGCCSGSGLHRAYGSTNTSD